MAAPGAGRGVEGAGPAALDPAPSAPPALPAAHLFPDKVTHTVNRGDTAVLSARVRKEKQTDVLWKSNGEGGIRSGWAAKAACR